MRQKKISGQSSKLYWAKQARTHRTHSDASWSDREVLGLEVYNLLKYLNDGDRVLDVGCANGHATLQFARQKKIRIRGVDFIPEMIRHARTNLKRTSSSLRGKADFKVDNVMSLEEPDAIYDKVIVIRVIINLDRWNDQLRSLRECGRVLKPGGTLLLSEATLQGWGRLNDFRREWRLPDIPMPAFNNYLDEKKVMKALCGKLELLAVNNFASTYYVGTRVIKPLLIQALGTGMDPANPNMEWNRYFARLPQAGDYGPQKLFVFRKRSV